MRRVVFNSSVIGNAVMVVAGTLLAAALPPAASALTEQPIHLAMSLFTQDEPSAPPTPRSKLKDLPAPTPAPSAGPSGSPAPAARTPSPPSAPNAAPPAATAALPPRPSAPLGPGAPVPGSAPPASPAQTGPVSALPSPVPGSPGAPKPLEDLTAITSTDGYTYDPKSRRDPFQSMAKLLKASQSRAELPPLQRVELSDVKLIGIVSDHSGYYGLIQTPDGKGYTVRVGTLMGTNNGTIKAIKEQKIIVAEPTLDVTGKMTTREIEILQRPKEGTE